MPLTPPLRPGSLDAWHPRRPPPTIVHLWLSVCWASGVPSTHRVSAHVGLLKRLPASSPSQPPAHSARPAGLPGSTSPSDPPRPPRADSPHPLLGNEFPLPSLPLPPLLCPERDSARKSKERLSLLINLELCWGRCQKLQNITVLTCFCLCADRGKQSPPEPHRTPRRGPDGTPDELVFHREH